MSSSLASGALIKRTLDVGERVGGKYVVQREIGRGATATVYEAVHHEIETLRVAIKLLRGAHVDDERVVRRFRREAQTVARLTSPHVVRVHDLGTHRELPYLVLEYVDGDTLETLIQRVGRLPERLVVLIGMHICHALAEAHSRGVMHRDVKPANIFVARDEATQSWCAKILDFGIAKLFDGADGPGNISMTQTASVHCTPLYAAPELLQGEAVPQSDLYALGITLAEALDGFAPYVATTAFQVATLHMTPTPVPLGERASASPLAPILQRATAKQLDRRYSSAARMREDIEKSFQSVLSTGSLSLDRLADELSALEQLRVDSNEAESRSVEALDRLIAQAEVRRRRGARSESAEHDAPPGDAGALNLTDAFDASFFPGSENATSRARAGTSEAAAEQEHAETLLGAAQPFDEPTLPSNEDDAFEHRYADGEDELEERRVSGLSTEELVRLESSASAPTDDDVPAEEFLAPHGSPELASSAPLHELRDAASQELRPTKATRPAAEVSHAPPQQGARRKVAWSLAALALALAGIVVLMVTGDRRQDRTPSAVSQSEARPGAGATASGERGQGAAEPRAPTSPARPPAAAAFARDRVALSLDAARVEAQELRTLGALGEVDAALRASLPEARERARQEAARVAAARAERDAQRGRRRASTRDRAQTPPALDAAAGDEAPERPNDNPFGRIRALGE